MADKTYGDVCAEGEALMHSGDWAGALKIWNMILEQQIAAVGPLCHAGACLAKMDNVGVGIALLSLATMRGPEHGAIWGNLAALLREAHRYEEAIDVGKKALELHEGDSDSHMIVLGNLCGAYVNQGRPLEGIVYGKRARLMARRLGLPDPAPVENNLGLLMLEAGQWRDGWQHYRRRLEIDKYGHQPRHYPGVKWDGKSRVGHLVIHGEQGLGDEIMFLSLMQDVLCKQPEEAITLEVAPRLVNLARRSFPLCHAIGHPSEFTGSCDAHIAMGDLPALWRNGKPPQRSGYLRPVGKPGRWKNTVLLAFHGGTKATHEGLRNPPLAAWSPLIEAVQAAGCGIYSIQYGDQGAEEAEALDLYHLQKIADDLDEQASAIGAASALVSVQQTALHLGGAIGTPTLGIIPSRPAWRYGVSGRMPWYETVTLYRQKADDWTAPIAGAINHLKVMGLAR